MLDNIKCARRGSHRDFCIPLVGLTSKRQPDPVFSATSHLDSEFLHNYDDNEDDDDDDGDGGGGGDDDGDGGGDDDGDNDEGDDDGDENNVQSLLFFLDV